MTDCLAKLNCPRGTSEWRAAAEGARPGCAARSYTLRSAGVGLRVVGMPGAYHSELWKKSWTAEEQQAEGASVACGCAVLPVKNCGGGGGAWKQADECT